MGGTPRTPHHELVTPELRRIEVACLAGGDDPEWYRQQAAVLHMRLLQGRRRASTRRELARTVALVTDRIHEEYRGPLGPEPLAAGMGVSPFHLLRVLRGIHGVTP